MKTKLLNKIRKQYLKFGIMDRKQIYLVTTHVSFGYMQRYIDACVQFGEKFKSYSIQKCNNNIQWYVLTMEVKYDKNN